MSLEIRHARLNEAATIVAVERDAARLFRSVPGLEWLADQQPSAETYDRLIGAGTVWVADDSGAACGFLAAQTEQHSLHIVELSVRAEYQRRGIGRALIDAAIAHGRHMRLPALTLTTFRAVPWNEPFYARCGFVTLLDAELDGCLLAKLDAEAAAGLPRERRCAMRLDLEQPG